MKHGHPKIRALACFLQAAVILAIQAAPPARAVPPLASTRAIQRRLGAGQPDGSSSCYNLSYVPVLLDLAKVLARFERNVYFVIRSDPFSNYPGIDLRKLLLLQSSPLTIPEGLSDADAGMPAAEPGQPTLSVPALEPEAAAPSHGNQEFVLPDVAVIPLPTTAPICKIPARSAGVGSPEKVKLTVPANELSGSPGLSFDFEGIAQAWHGSAQPSVEAAFLPRIHTPFPSLVSFNQPLHNITPFLFWTCRAAERSARGARAAAGQAGSRYEGTFVACRQGTQLSYIKDRQIGLIEGRAVGANRGGNLEFVCAAATVKIEPGASALVQFDEKRILHVLAIESSAPGRVSVSLKTRNGSRESIRLLQGEALIAGDHLLSPAEIADCSGLSVTVTAQGQIAHGRFTMSDLFAREPLLDAGNRQLTPEQSSALSELRMRVNANDMADQLPSR